MPLGSKTGERRGKVLSPLKTRERREWVLRRFHQ